METSSTATMESTHERSQNRSCGSHLSKGGNWTGFNVVAMVLGFVFFWPVGLLILFWILSGRHVQDLPGAIRSAWSSVRGGHSRGHRGPTDNVVFNEFQQTQYDRIREIREEIGASARRFNEFREGARRRADEEEFNRFMASAPDRSPG